MAVDINKGHLKKLEVLPDGWGEAFVNDVVEIVSTNKKKLPQKNYLAQGAYPVIDQGQEFVSGYSDDEELLVDEEPPFVVFGDHTRVFKYANFKFVPGADGVKVLKPVGVDPKWCYYLFQAIRLPNKGYARHFQYLKESYLPVPPPEQQKRIVVKIEQLFSHIDAGIEGLKKAKQLLKQYRQSVLKAAVTGELTRQWREQNKDKLESASKLLERILAERRKKWEEQQMEQFKAKGKMPKDDKWKEKYKEPILYSSDIEIPESWVGVSTDQVFYYVTSGSRGWAKYYSEEGPIFLRMGNLEHYDVRLDLEDIQRVSPPEGAEGSRTQVEAGDSLISITADVGMVGIVPDEFEEAYINQHVALARPVIHEMGLYMAWLLSGDFAKEQFKALQRGATKVGLGLDDIKSIQFGLPPLEEQNEIVRLIEEKLSSIEHLNNEIDRQLFKAAKNKQSILASAFSGKLVAQEKEEQNTYLMAAEGRSKYGEKRV